MDRMRYCMDTIIDSLKASPGFENVRFVREYGNTYIENPISGFLAVVRVKGFGVSESYLGGLAPDKSKGCLSFAEAEIAVYAPKSKNGSGLSKIAGDMISVLKTVDDGSTISGLRASSIEFDQNLCAVFRRLSFKLEFYSGDESDG